MNIINIHEREIAAEASEVGALIDLLASDKDGLWPKTFWPPIFFDRPLGVDAVGGHGPISYIVEEYRPGLLLKFRFLVPRGFHGYHSLEVLAKGKTSAVIRHTIDMRIDGFALLSWPLIVRPLHDALLEDALAQAQASFGTVPSVRPWSLWVRSLRWLMSRGRARRQQPPNPSIQHSLRDEAE